MQFFGRRFLLLISTRKSDILYKRLYSSNPTIPLQRTCLYDFHVAQGGKMVPFAGWEMPVQYKDSIPASHTHVRSSVGIFDVSHMLQTRVTGKDCRRYMESLVVADVEGLSENHGTLSVFTNNKGGIEDDLIITNTGDGYLYVVSNAGCRDKDFANMKRQAEKYRSDGMDVQVEMISNALLAVQGPQMTKVLQPGIDHDLSSLPFMTSTMATVFGIPDCRVTRCGYTGEDGVEISVEKKHAVNLVEKLLLSQEAEVRLAGLGARDSLRLEAGLCLYGNDINEETTPVEASLLWVIAKRRRQTADFPGASIILEQIKSKPKRKRVGFISTGPPARAGTQIFDESGSKSIGSLTSGCPSPSLKKNISMGYVETPFSKTGTCVKFEIRKKKYEAEVVKMPFVPSKYYILK